MKKWLRPLLIICTFALVICGTCGLAACNLVGSGEGLVTQIQLENTEIYVTEVGEASTFQIEPIIIPANAADKGVVYRLMDSADREFLSVSQDGVVTALKEKPEGVVIVRIHSKQRPSVYLDVRIHVESQEVTVKKIEFNPQEIQLKLTDKPYLAEPVFSPYYAAQGRELTWSSLNDDYATVDSAGRITPKSPGVTYIVAASVVPGVDPAEAVQGRIKVTVTYADLSYRINMENNGPGVMRQIVGQAEEIRLNLLQMDELCDPNPLIRWYVGNERISESEGKREFRYTPEKKPYGEYTIRAEVSNNLQMLKLEYDIKLRMMEPLTGFDVNVLNEAEKLQAGDVIMLQAGLPERAYVPESFRWFVRLKGEQEETYIQTTDTPELNYKLTKEGEYIFRAAATIKGKDSAVECVTQGIQVDLGNVGTNVYDIYFDAYLENGEIVPAIKWRYPGYAANYTIELTKEDGSVQLITSERVESGVAPMALLPEVTVNEDFSVRVRTESYGWSESCAYKAGTLQESDRAFFARIEAEAANGYGLGMNGYIVNMKEMGDLLNYISLFRPASLWDEGEGEHGAYVVHYKTAFRYSDLDAEKYPCTQESSTDNVELKDVFRIMNAAFNAYAETGSFRAGYKLENGGVRLSMTFNDALPTELKKTDQTGVAEGNTKAHYATKGAERLPIEREMRAQITVSTSDQLLYALTHGLYPVCLEGSAAERVWKKARAVSLRIIGDGMTDAEKVHAIYDYLTLEIIYDYALLDLANANLPVTDYAGFYMEGVFDDGVAVCDGISKAFVLLARMQGIAAEKVAGRAGSGASEVGHAWARVLVDGRWYVCDPTWGNRKMTTISMETQTHGYLLVSDEVIARDHRGFGEFPPAPESMDIYFGVNRGGYDAVLDDEEEMKRGVRAVMFPILENASECYWEVTLSDAMKEKLKDLYPLQSEHNALSTMFGDFINTNGYDAVVYAVGGDKYYLWATKKETA